MEHISESIKKYNKQKTPSSERSYVIQCICEEMFTQKDFKKLLGQTKQLTTEEIRHIFDAAKSWHKNPKALFWKLLKEKNDSVKTELEKEKEGRAKTKGKEYL